MSSQLAQAVIAIMTGQILQNQADERDRAARHGEARRRRRQMRGEGVGRGGGDEMRWG